MKAVEELDGKEYKESMLSLCKFVSAKNRTLAAKTNLYVKNFPSEWDQKQVEEELAKLFGGYGKTTSIGVY